MISLCFKDPAKQVRIMRRMSDLVIATQAEVRSLAVVIGDQHSVALLVALELIGAVAGVTDCVANVARQNYAATPRLLWG